MKTFGANIVCRECGAQPHPDPESGLRESFDVRRFGDDWLCEEHRPPGAKRASRVTVVTPAKALDEFERILASEFVSLEEAVSADEDSVEACLRHYNEKVERALQGLRKAIAAQTARVEKTAQNKRSALKPLTLEGNHEGQTNLIEEEGASHD